MGTSLDDKEFYQLGWWSPTVDNVTVAWFTGDDWRRISIQLESWLTILNLWDGYRTLHTLERPETKDGVTLWASTTISSIVTDPLTPQLPKLASNSNLLPQRNFSFLL